MSSEEIINAALEVLNSAFEADPAAVQSLLEYEVPCNDALADHPTVIMAGVDPDTSQSSVSALGLINGILCELTGVNVASKWLTFDEGSGHKLFGFCKYDNAH